MPIEYLAGLIDGEGCFSIQVEVRGEGKKRSVWVNPRITINLRHGTEVLDKIVEYYGGNIYTTGSSGSRAWNLRADKSVELAEKLLPHLRIKRKTCEKYLYAMSIRKNYFWDVDELIELAEISLNLNGKTRKTPEQIQQRFDEIRELYRESAPSVPILQLMADRRNYDTARNFG